ncbi:unnamed protein product, partial [marine sediment metagenome]
LTVYQKNGSFAYQKTTGNSVNEIQIGGQQLWQN